jgi:hypothetical protein
VQVVLVGEVDCPGLVGKHAEFGMGVLFLIMSLGLLGSFFFLQPSSLSVFFWLLSFFPPDSEATSCVFILDVRGGG